LDALFAKVWAGNLKVSGCPNARRSGPRSQQTAPACDARRPVDKTAKSQQITAESLAAEAEEVRQHAMRSGQLSAAITAIKEKGVLSGQRIERKEVGPPDSFDHLTDDELERAIIERFKALGLMDKALGLRPDVDQKAGADQPAPDAESDTRH
jgi:hypothetical protein